jgi:Protein of unknown function (DUF2958)
VSIPNTPAPQASTPIVYSQPDRRFKGHAYNYIRAADRLPTYPEISDVADPLCKVKLFLPAGRFTYFVAAVTDYEGTLVLSGYGISALDPHFDGFEDASLEEIARARAGGLPVERDLHFTALTVKELEARIARGATP